MDMFVFKYTNIGFSKNISCKVIDLINFFNLYNDIVLEKRLFSLKLIFPFKLRLLLYQKNIESFDQLNNNYIRNLWFKCN